MVDPAIFISLQRFSLVFLVTLTLCQQGGLVSWNTITLYYRWKNKVQNITSANRNSAPVSMRMTANLSPLQRKWNKHSPWGSHCLVWSRLYFYIFCYMHDLLRHLGRIAVGDIVNTKRVWLQLRYPQWYTLHSQNILCEKPPSTWCDIASSKVREI